MHSEFPTKELSSCRLCKMRLRVHVSRHVTYSVSGVRCHARVEMNRDQSVVFEIAPRYCILDSFVDYDGYSISSRDSCP